MELTERERMQAAARVLADIARVQDRERFAREASMILGSARSQATVEVDFRDWQKRSPKEAKALAEVEDALQAAYKATRKLSPDMRLELGDMVRSLYEGGAYAGDFEPLEADWEELLEMMICALPGFNRAEIARGRGCPRRRNAFLGLVAGLARCVDQNGGRLPFNRKKAGSSRWISVFDVLRPIFPKGFIPEALPLAMIEQALKKPSAKLGDD
jgi:hypothetical protein